MAVDGGIVTGQVTASLDGLERQHLAELRAVLVQHAGGAGPLNDIRMAVDQALQAWNAHDSQQAELVKT